MVLPDFGRGAPDQELQVSAGVGAAAIQEQAAAADHGDAAAERDQRAVVADALPDAEHLRLLAGLPGLVQGAHGPGHAEEPAHQPAGHFQAAPDIKALPAAPAEEGRREVAAPQEGDNRNLL